MAIDLGLYLSDRRDLLGTGLQLEISDFIEQVSGEVNDIGVPTLGRDLNGLEMLHRILINGIIKLREMKFI